MKRVELRSKTNHLAHDVLGDVTASRFEKSKLSSNVGTRNDAGSADESGTNVRDNRSVQVRHNHNVELLGSVDKLHRGVIDTVRQDERNKELH